MNTIPRRTNPIRAGSFAVAARGTPATQIGRLLIYLLICLALVLPAHAHASDQTAVDPNEALTVRGTIDLEGTAAHPTFRKWQLDLLLNGVPGNDTFVAWGVEQVTQVAPLARLDTTVYPDGLHLLRLRVVHSNLNYDEYYTPILIANHNQISGQVYSRVRIPDRRGTAPGASAQEQLEANGLRMEQGPAAGVVALSGVADHPAFRKWQIDFLPAGDPERSEFVAMGTEAAAQPRELARLDTTTLPNGEHLLRLRVVRSDTNYDEFLTPITIANAADQPPSTEVAAPAPILDTSRAPVDGRRLIEVDLSDQTLTAWQGDVPVLHTKVSTGRPETPTVLGRYQVRVKLPSQHMRGPDYSLPDVPAVMYFYRGYAIHGAYWHNNFGQVMSHGCVNMRPHEAQALYEWADLGTEVYVHE